MKPLFLHVLTAVSICSLTECALSADRQTGISLVINELMASNVSTIQDPQGQYDDWIEIYNFGGEAVNIGGMYLTDDLSDPTKWRIPTDRPIETTIPAHGYLLIWADNDTADAGLHASFKLDAAGEEVGLFAASVSGTDGVALIDYIVFGEQTADISFGRDPGADYCLAFLISPTPGTANSAGYTGRVDEPEFSHPHGFYSAPFSVAITTDTEGATIYYTLDGSEPYNTDTGRPLPTAVPYTRPIFIDKTTCLRATAVQDGWKPSKTVACSYIFLDGVIQQPVRPEGFPNRWGSRNADYEMDPEIVNDPRYRENMKTALTAIPTVSIVMNTGAMFGNEGIYSNPRNEDMEKPASVELIYPDGTQEGFQVNCGIKIMGGASRHMSLKNSFRLLFKSIYGPSRLTFPLFGPDAASEFNTIALRSSFNDGYGWNGARHHEQYTRDEFIRALQRNMGHVSPNSMLAHLYINGLYWGIYFPCERPDASFSASYYGGDEEDWDTFSHPGITVREGNSSALNQMINLCRQVSDSDEAYQRLQGNNPDGSRNPDSPRLLDVTNYIDYLLLNYCVNNEDWPWNNYWFARRRTADSTGFKFYSWDSEISLYLPPRAHMTLNRTGDFRNVGQFQGYLIQNREHRLAFADRVHRHLFNDGILTPDYMRSLYSHIADRVEMPVICESARWGDMHHHPPLNQDDWYHTRDWLMENFFTQRHDIVLQQLKGAGLYPAVEAPTFYVNGAYQHGGHMDRLATLTMESPSGVIYYTLNESDPRQSGTGAQPAGGMLLVAENAAKKVLVPTGPVDDDWKGNLLFDDSAWISGMGGVGYERSTGYEQFFSINVYDQMYGRNATCYIRIPFDPPAGSIDGLTSLTLKVRYDDGFIAYLNGVEVQRVSFGGSPAWNSSASTNRSDLDAINLQTFDISGYAGLVRAGGNILAIQGLNESRTSSDLLISVELTAGQGSPHSGSRISPTAIEYQGPITLSGSAHIKSRVLDGDTWSALNEATFAVGPVADTLRTTEIMYHPQDTGDPSDPYAEFIELQNIGTETLNLNLVTFTNGIDFTFPDIDLRPGEYVVVVKDLQVFAARYGTDIFVAGQYSGSLANNGERVRLEDAAGQTILDFEYNDDWYEDTDGRGYSLTIVDAANPDPNSWSQKQSWQVSASRGGSPG